MCNSRYDFFIQLLQQSLGPLCQQDDVRKKLAELVTGFPISVFYNKEHLSRYHAFFHTGFVKTDIGYIKIDPPFTTEAQIFSWLKNTAFYMSGLPLFQFNNYYNEGGYHASCWNIVHLDSEIFHANNGMLLDPDLQETRIRNAFNSLWRKILLEHKNTLKPETFADKYYLLCKETANQDLLWDMPIPLDTCKMSQWDEEVEIMSCTVDMRPGSEDILITRNSVDFCAQVPVSILKIYSNKQQLTMLLLRKN